MVAAPWKNGGGVTREIAAEPPRAGLDAFAWRVSIADVAQPGPFSRFAGVERTLVLLSGAGMVLDEKDDGGCVLGSHILTRLFEVARFDGDARIDARLIDGATRDFNLMVRRDAAQGRLDVWHGPARRSVSADVALLYCASGSIALSVDGAQPVTLDTGDTLRVDARNGQLQCNAEGAGSLLAIGIRYLRH